MGDQGGGRKFNVDGFHLPTMKGAQRRSKCVPVPEALSSQVPWVGSIDTSFASVANRTMTKEVLLCVRVRRCFGIWRVLSTDFGFEAVSFRLRIPICPFFLSTGIRNSATWSSFPGTPVNAAVIEIEHGYSETRLPGGRVRALLHGVPPCEAPATLCPRNTKFAQS